LSSDRPLAAQRGCLIRPDQLFHSAAFALILGHFWIDTVCPRQNTARQVLGLGEPSILQEAYRTRTAGAGTARTYQLFSGIQFMHASRKIIQRDQDAVEIAYLVFMRFAHVKDDQVLFGVKTLLQFFHADFRNSGAHRLFLSSHSTEFFVIDEFSHSGVSSANHAIRILAQLEFAELHAQRIHQQQPPDQRLAAAKNQLNGFRRLDQAYQAGQNAEHAALGARRHKPWRWRLRIQAAIARSVFGRKNTGLAFEPENRSINVGLAGEYAGVIHQKTRRKVVCSVNDDVEVRKDLERVLARQFRVKSLYVDKRIDGRDFLFRRLQLGTANIAGEVDHLALQVGKIHHVKVDQPDRPHPGGREIQRQRRSQTARPDAQHARRLQFLLALHAHFRHDAVPWIAEHFFVVQ